MFLKPAEVVSFSKFSEIRRANALRTFDGLGNLVMLRLHHADLVDLAWEMFNGLENLQVGMGDKALHHINISIFYRKFQKSRCRGIKLYFYR